MPDSHSTTSRRVCETCFEGVRVLARPEYLRERSQPGKGVHRFGRQIVIGNECDVPVTIVEARWTTIDGEGRREEGCDERLEFLQPTIEPGTAVRAVAFHTLESAWGTVDGRLAAVRPDGRRIEIPLPRVVLTPG